MPWKETFVVDERLKFLGEYLKQERSMSELCRDYGISRKTGYKFVNRYLNEGLIGAYDRSRAPHNHPNAVTEDLVSAILSLRSAHPRWGPRKLRAWLVNHHPRTRWPSPSTIGRLLARRGKVIYRVRSRRTPPYTQPFSSCASPNALWSADFKGWFRTGDGQRCEPLTITDGYSRYVLECRTLSRTTNAAVRPLFEAVFRQYGLPWAIRTDNGAPFASRALGGLSRLAVWWIKLGIKPERIDPGCPQQNGRHERFHRTLKDETICPPKGSAIEQQQAFDAFCQEYNYDRPHEALEDRTPASVYTSSLRPYPTRLLSITYPDNMIIRKVRPCGSIRWRGRETYISETLVGEPIALEQTEEHLFQLYYGPVKLAIYDDAKKKLIRPPVTRRKRY